MVWVGDGVLLAGAPEIVDIDAGRFMAIACECRTPAFRASLIDFDRIHPVELSCGLRIR